MQRESAAWPTYQSGLLLRDTSRDEAQGWLIMAEAGRRSELHSPAFQVRGSSMAFKPNSLTFEQGIY